VVDVANVMGSRPDGWWRDRAGAAVRLYSELAALAASGRAILPGPTGPRDAGPPPDAAGPPAKVVVVGGGAPAAAPPVTTAETPRGQQSETAGGQPAIPTGPGQAQPGRVRVVEARGSGDDAIVALARELPGRRVVVTADRALRDRSVAAGAAVLGPAWLLALLRP